MEKVTAEQLIDAAIDLWGAPRTAIAYLIGYIQSLETAHLAKTGEPTLVEQLETIYRTRDMVDLADEAPEEPRFELDERSGCVGIIDTHDSRYAERGPGLGQDYWAVVAFWQGRYLGENMYWTVDQHVLDMAKWVLDLLNSPEKETASTRFVVEDREKYIGILDTANILYMPDSEFEQNSPAVVVHWHGWYFREQGKVVVDTETRDLAHWLCNFLNKRVDDPA